MELHFLIGLLGLNSGFESASAAKGGRRGGSFAGPGKTSRQIAVKVIKVPADCIVLGPKSLCITII